MRTREELVEAALAGARRTEEGFVRATDLCRANDPTVGVIMQANPEINKQVWWGTAGGHRCYVTRTDVARAILAHLPTNKLRRHAAPPAPSVAPASSVVLAEPETAPSAAAEPETAPSAAAPSQVLEATTVQEQLSKLLGRSVQLRLRVTPEGLLSLIDVTAIFTGLDMNHSAEAARNTLRRHPDFNDGIVKFKFPGRGRQTVDVAPLPVALEFAFLLPGRNAAQLRVQAARLLVRYLGGDLSLVDEVVQLRHVQHALAQAEPASLTPEQQLGRACGEAVECSAAGASPLDGARVPPTPQLFRHERSIALPGNGHLYAARRVGDDIMKVGVTKDVLARLGELQRSFSGTYDLLAVWPGEEPLEEIVLGRLRDFKAVVGSSREHFDSRVTLGSLVQIVDSAREHYILKKELEAQSFEGRKRELELQEELEDRRVKRRREERALEVVAELARSGNETALAALVRLLPGAP
jgi:hypothetical protein